MTQTPPELKPCPFCGDEAYTFKKWVTLEYWASVGCKGCSAKFSEECPSHASVNPIHDELVEKWNTRADLHAALVAENARMQTVIAEAYHNSRDGADANVFSILGAEMNRAALSSGEE